LRELSFAGSSGSEGILQNIDARVKLFLSLSGITSLALVREPSVLQLFTYGLALCVIAGIGRLPLHRILRRSLFVVPFVGFFAFVVYVTGGHHRAGLILCKSYLSALTVVVLVSCTPLPQIFAAARYFRAPDLLVEVVQLTYRYLFVLGSEARAMQTAFLARGGKSGRAGLRAASGMVSVLFARAYAKASMVYSAMRSRGFYGTMRRPVFPRITWKDVSFAVVGFTLCVALHAV
jgi:cobalt/nickel transport system permease protein